MSKANGQKPRHFSADEKLKILEEARAPGATVAEMLRRYQLEGTTFSRWEHEAKAAMRDALAGKARGDARLRELERENERLRAELETKRRVISEVLEENLALKGGL
jgi:transposase-like protein